MARFTRSKVLRICVGCIAALVFQSLTLRLALARKMFDYDLPSLVVVSQHIVLVERIGSVSPQNPLGNTCRVKKVYLGSILPDATFPVPGLRAYSFRENPFGEEGHGRTWDP